MLIFFSVLILFVLNSAANDDLKSCQLKDGGTGKCVLMHLCVAGKVNRNGLYLVDIRLGESGDCHFLEDCCDVGDIKITTPTTLKPTSIVQTTLPPYVVTPVDPEIFVTPGVIPNTEKPTGEASNFDMRCGKRNPNGIGYRILEVVDHEAEYGEFPWMVAVLKKQGVDDIPDVYAGGGSLIHPSVVLTAAHIISEKNPQILKVRVGEWDTTTDGERYEHADHDVDDLVIHPEYDETILYNDVALLFLKYSVAAQPHIGTICLPPEANFDQHNCFVSGWGKNRFGKDGHYQTILKKIELPFVNRDKCQTMLRETRLGQWYELHESFVCAGGKPEQDACVGDGGSPLVCPIEGVKDHYFQAGIVAWGIGCGLADVPGVYVNVAKYRGWIEQEVAKKSYDTVHFTNPSSIG